MAVYLSWLMMTRCRMETVHMEMSRLVCTWHKVKPRGHLSIRSMMAEGSMTKMVTARSAMDIEAK